MRIDGHTDNEVGQIFHVKNKTLLSSAMWAAIDFLTWDTKFPLTKHLQEKGYEASREWLSALMEEASVRKNYGRPATEKPSAAAPAKGAQPRTSPGTRPSGAPSPGRPQQ